MKNKSLLSCRNKKVKRWLILCSFLCVLCLDESVLLASNTLFSANLPQSSYSMRGQSGYVHATSKTQMRSYGVQGVQGANSAFSVVGSQKGYGVMQHNGSVSYGSYSSVSLMKPYSARGTRGHDGFFVNHTQSNLLQNQSFSPSARAYYPNIGTNTVSSDKMQQQSAWGYAAAERYISGSGSFLVVRRLGPGTIGDDDIGGEHNVENPTTTWGQWLQAYYKWLATQNGESEDNWKNYLNDFSRLQEWWDEVFDKNNEYPDLFYKFKEWCTPMGDAIWLLVVLAALFGWYKKLIISRNK